jgi:hypothetical protein
MKHLEPAETSGGDISPPRGIPFPAGENSHAATCSARVEEPIVDRERSLAPKSTRNLDGNFRKASARLSALTSAVIQNSFLKYRAQPWPELALP